MAAIGVVFIVIGALMFLGEFQRLNNYFAGLEFLFNSTAGAEDRLRGGVPGLFGIAWPAGTDGPRRRWLAGRAARGISTSALRERLCAHTNSFAEESGHWRDITIAYGPRGDRVSVCSTNPASSCVLRSASPGARCRAKAP